MDTPTLNPSPSQLKALADLPADGPLVMLNLLRFDPKTDPDGLDGAARYARYKWAAGPFLQAAGGRVIWQGKPLAAFIGPEAEADWDEMLLVEYPGKDAFMQMLSQPDYPAQMRTEALLDSRLWICAAR